MKQFIRDYLTFNKRERNGLFVLLAIITLLIVYLNISDKFIKQEKVDFTKFEKEIEIFNKSAQQINDSIKQANENKYIYKKDEHEQALIAVKKQPEYFDFNPNNLPENNWQLLGLTEKQIHTIKNYESKGGKFRSKEDLKKMYCIPEKEYLSLEPYIQIPNEKKVLPKYEAIKPENKGTNSENLIVEINTADSALLTRIKGIGPFYAKTIIKYRKLLGGFAAKEQLMEMWKFDSVKFSGIENYIIVDPTEIKKININICTAAQLKHPYISWNIANAIYNYRIKHGQYIKLEDIKKTDLVDDKTYRKIVPYLTLQ
jgi:DNA uptake protein ComE-like DNA-binding protein